MREAMLAYFHAEKHEALLFLLAGVGALLTSGLLLRGDGPWRSIMLVLDLFAAQRGRAYVEAVARLATGGAGY